MAVTLIFMGLNALVARGFGWGAQTAFLVSYPPALAVHFTLNKLWTFRDRRATSARHFGDYLFSVVVTFLIQWPAFLALHGLFHLRGWVAAGGANVVQMVASYLFLRQMVFGAAQSGRPPEALPSWHRLSLLLAVCTAVLFYGWTVKTARHDIEFLGPKRDYYNLLVQGFRKGHLYMDAAPDPALLALPANERPGSAPYLLDASLYRGHYYLYFGIVPAVLLYLPYTALTGNGFPEPVAALLFAVAGLLFSTLWWCDVRRRFFPKSGAVWAFVSILGIAIGSAVPSTLRRPLFYEVAITAGYGFTMLALWAFTRAFFATRRKEAWLVLGAVAAGLAVGSRANLGPACTALVVCGSITAGIGNGRWISGALLKAGLAFGAILLALGAYNVARFGNPLEFGHSYQLGLEPRQLFHLDNLGHNIGVYYLQPPTLNGYFPFVAPAAEAIKPHDYVGRESAHGEWVWLPLAIFAFGAWVWMALKRAGPVSRDRAIIIGLPLMVFAVNFIVTSSVGVRANRYMLDFHPIMVLAVVAVLGMAIARKGWIARAGALVGGGVIVVAIVFNALGSMQAHEFFRATDPSSYASIASVADRIVWPWLRSTPAVGDRIVSLRWPASPSYGAMDPIGAAGSPGFDDVLWVEYGKAGIARFVYQYWEHGRAFGSWFAIETGKKSEVRVSGALLLPRPGHPWYGERPTEHQMVLKRGLSVSVDGATRFERDVPSHDSSPRLQTWGAWRNAEGHEHVFSGEILGVRHEPVQDLAVRRATADRGTVRMHIKFPPLCDGRYEPLMQSGSVRAFDTLVIRYSRPGFIQLFHDQFGSGARSSREFPVDYSAIQHVEIEMPFADDRVAWTETGPSFLANATDRIRVTWNGLVVFEPDVPPVKADRGGVVLGANMLHSSIAEALFGGILEKEPSMIGLGGLGEGTLMFQPSPAGAFESDRGILVRFARNDGREAGLAWRRGESARGVFLGWTDTGGTVWSRVPLAAEKARTIAISLSKDETPIGLPSGSAAPGSLGRLVVEVGSTTILAQRTSFFSTGEMWGEGSGGGEWSCTALLNAPGSGSTVPVGGGPPQTLPGRVRFAFIVPMDGQLSSSPVLMAGRVGAADSVYLRSLLGGRYVVGLDHWSVGSAESAPFDLTAGDIHSIGIEMSSLDPDGRLPDGVFRVSMDGRLIMDRRLALYPVRPGEVIYGANPLGMSTSSGRFEGDLISVRTHQAAEALFLSDR